MRVYIRSLTSLAMCIAVGLPAALLADEPVTRPAQARQPAQANPIVPITAPTVAPLPATPIAPTPAPRKPDVFTAVVPRAPHSASDHSIIFVGGRSLPGSQVELNPQPIPPGHGNLPRHRAPIKGAQP